MLNQAANLISDVADAVAMQGNDDLKRHMHSMVDEIHRQFGSHEDEVAGI
jgi:phosphate uptake regulator